MRMTIGAANRLSVRQQIVPQLLICSVEGSAYLRYWISGTGINPAYAIPTARPIIPSSDKLVSNTRCAPCVTCNPRSRHGHPFYTDILTKRHTTWVNMQLPNPNIRPKWPLTYSTVADRVDEPQDCLRKLNPFCNRPQIIEFASPFYRKHALGHRMCLCKRVRHRGITSCSECGIDDCSAFHSSSLIDCGTR